MAQLSFQNMNFKNTLQIISEVLSGITNPNDEMQCYKAWDKYLSKRLAFPFEAIVIEVEESEVFKYGDKISVKKIDDCFNGYGLIAEVRFGRKKYFQQICNIETTDKKSDNFVLMEAYKEWFDNK